ncbi:MAG: cytochrome c oxidase subunit II [Actinomycetota bacterium]|nr:cytochrome c oxidase subunit II [Actinomycetota bacterium]
MRRHAVTAPHRRPRKFSLVVVVLAAALVLSGCGAQLERGYLPEAVTESGPNVISFWNATWIAALAVGVFVWGLILWCVVAYRRKKSDTGLPEQIRYNVPLEILYTVVPVLMMAVLFGKTVELQNELLDTEQEADVVVNVVGKQWSWDFNYVNEDVYITGTQAIELSRGEPGLPETLPTLVLPVDARVEFVLTARDVIHSFWVPQFLQKLDMLPGRVNVFQVTTTEEGSFTGKCAELCGAYHSQMLFEVDVVSQQEYDQHIADLEAAGNTGQLDNGLNRAEFIDGQVDKLPEGSN